MHVRTLRMTGPTSVPEAPVEFVHGLGMGIVAVDHVSGAGDWVRALVLSIHVGSFGGVEDGDRRRRFHKCGPWFHVGRVPLPTGLTRLGVVGYIHTKSTIPWRLGND